MMIQCWVGESLAMTAKLCMPLALSLHKKPHISTLKTDGEHWTTLFVPLSNVATLENIAVFCFSPLLISLIDVILLQSR